MRLGAFNPGHPAIFQDGQNPDRPKTVFGLIVAGLKRRKAAGIPPFTIMSCDNIPGNGEVTEECRRRVGGAVGSGLCAMDRR
jgi:mannitol 2-dehydrogenase